jgi:ribonuclease P protein component
MVYVLRREPQYTDENRFGVSCSKKVGNSVTRHLVTRRYREAFRAWVKENNTKSKTDRHHDVVVSVYPEAANAKYCELKDSLSNLLEQIMKNYA